MPVRVLLIQERITFEAADKQRNDVSQNSSLNWILLYRPYPSISGTAIHRLKAPRALVLNDAGMKVKISPIDQDLHKIGEDRNYACGFSVCNFVWIFLACQRQGQMWQFSFLALLAGSSSQQPDWTQWTEGEIKPLVRVVTRWSSSGASM
ncbi:hypothetical protein BDFG_02393 [Blastomyces dermatitidis ATCC 26199]|nr:hypothetical protein BDFG_02393 [Blastomyces dermatitidis ATCC 26199]